MKKLLLCILILCLLPGICGCAGQRYKIDYSGQKSSYTGARNSYRAGQTVVLYYKMIATDTDYSFYLDDESIPFTWVEGKGFKIEFTMPEHDVTLLCGHRNSMIALPSDR